MSKEKKKRIWVLMQPPSIYEMGACPKCENTSTVWSEWDDHVWCPECNLDFIPQDKGVFDGPVCMQVCRMLGIYFDRQNLETGEIEFYDYDKGEYTTASYEEYQKSRSSIALR